MPNLVTDLIVDRVDLVDEGANSAAFIALYKRKEPETMTWEEILQDLEPEHAEVLKAKIAEGDKAITDLADTTSKLNDTQETLKATEAKLPCECDGEADENGICKECGRKKAVAKNAAFDETEVLKNAPKELMGYIETLKSQKAAAEAIVRQATEERIEAEATAKALTLKSLPIEQAKLVGILKGASTEIVDLLAAANTAIEVAVLGEVGKAAGTATNAADSNKAWAKIETEADKLMKSKDGLTKEQAIAQVVKAMPQLYKEYVDGGAE